MNELDIKYVEKSKQLFKNNFDVSNIVLYHRRIAETFNKIFFKLGSEKLNNVSIIPSNDRSVRFIGSATNIFKEYFVNKKIENNGYYLTQKCLRTRNLKTFFSDSEFSEWSSYFNVLGAIIPPEKIEIFFEKILHFLLCIGIESEDIRVSFYEKDIDLIQSVILICKKYNISVNFDSDDTMQKYRHKYGLDDVWGRNFNIALKNKKDEKFCDIGNIILIENHLGQIAVEVGIGIETLISKIFDLNSSVEASFISKLVIFKNNFFYKFFDSLCASVAMIDSGVKPGPKSREYLLKVYIIAMCYLKDKIEISYEDISRIVDEYEKQEFCKISCLGEKVVSYMKKYEKKIYIYIK